MLGASNTCVKLQSRVTISGTTIDILFSMGMGVELKIGFFMRDEGMGGENINQKEYSNFLVVELEIVISTGQNNWEVPWFGQRLGKREVETCGCGKIKWHSFIHLFNIA